MVCKIRFRFLKGKTVSRHENHHTIIGKKKPLPKRRIHCNRFNVTDWNTPLDWKGEKILQHSELKISSRVMDRLSSCKSGPDPHLNTWTSPKSFGPAQEEQGCPALPKVESLGSRNLRYAVLPKLRLFTVERVTLSMFTCPDSCRTSPLCEGRRRLVYINYWLWTLYFAYLHWCVFLYIVNSDSMYNKQQNKKKHLE